MKLYLKFEFHTDGDFYIEDVGTLIDIKSNLYKGANVKYRGSQSGETIWIELEADGDRNAGFYAARDLMQNLICNIRAGKYYLVKDLYDMIIPAKELLWSNVSASYFKDISGNYDGTYIQLYILVDGESVNEYLIDAVKKHLDSERETSQIYPFKVKNPTETQIEIIAAMCMTDDTDEIREMCGQVLGSVCDFI